MSASGTSAPERNRISSGRRRVFLLFTLSFPLLFLLVVEGGLRVVGFGNDYPLFVEADQTGTYLAMNPDVGHRFLSGDFVLPGVTRNRFLAEKSEDTYRIVVQGASTVLGYPYFHGGAFPRMLERRLQEAFPERRIEVVNTGMVAMNSYTLLDFADEIVDVEPDAVMVYAGHNEYYGALGVASSQRVGGSRAVVRGWLALRRFRTVQLLQAGIDAVRGTGAEAASDESRTWSSWSDMVPYGSSLYERGLDQLRENLGDLVERYRRADIPVFVATIVSNERDQRPFVSEPQPGVAPDAWATAARAALAELEGGDTAAARDVLASMTARDSLNAEAFYSTARSLDGAGAPELAFRLYAGARDRDHLRFRAPAAMNEILRQAATAPGVHLVDVEERFRSESSDRIVGGDLLLEHVHPRLEGASLIADAFYAGLRRAGELGPWHPPEDPGTGTGSPPTYTAVDSIYGELLVHQLTSGWPFRPGEAVGTGPSPAPSTDPVRRIAEALHAGEVSWPDAMQRLYQHRLNGGDPERARRAARALAQEYPELSTPLVMWGMAALRVGDANDALAATRRAYEREPSHRTGLMHGLALLASGERDRALAQIETAAREAPPEEPAAAAALSAARRLPRLMEAASSAGEPSALLELAEAYVVLQRTSEARELAEEVLRRQPGHSDAIELLERLTDPADPLGVP